MAASGFMQANKKGAFEDLQTLYPTLHLFNQICVIKFVSISIFLYVSTILEGSVHWYAGGSLRPYVTSGGLIGLAEESGC